MKIFTAFKFTGEDLNELGKTLGLIKASLEEQGHTMLCTFWDEEMFQRQNFTHRQIMEYGLDYLNRSDAVLVFVNSSEKSEGMLVEVGYAFAKGKPVMLAIKEGAVSRFAECIADRVIRFKDTPELLENLKVKNLWPQTALV